MYQLIDQVANSDQTSQLLLGFDLHAAEFWLVPVGAWHHVYV